MTFRSLADDSGLKENASFRQRIAFLFRDAAFYSVIGTFSRLTQLIVFPIIARLLSESEYGLTDITWAFISLFVPLVVLGQSTTIGRYYYDFETDKERKKVVVNGLIIQIAPILLVTTGLIFARDAVSKFLFNDKSYSNLIWIAFLALPSLAIQDNVLNILKYTFRRLGFAITASLPTVLVPIFVLVLVSRMNFGVEGVFISWALAYGISSFVGVLFCFDLFIVNIDFKLIRLLLAYGLPTIILVLLPTLLPVIDRVLVTRFIGLDAAGVYGVAQKLAKIPYFLVASFHIAYGPFALSTYKHEGSEKIFVKVLNFLVYGISIIAFGMVAFGQPLIIILASNKYIASFELLWPIVFAIVFRGASTIVWLGVAISKRTIYFLLGAIAQLLVAISLDYLLIPRIGILGAGIGMLAGEIVYFTIIAIAANHLYPIKYQYKICMLILMMSMIPSIFITQYPFRSYWIRTSIGLIVWISFIILGWYMISTVTERERVKLVLSKYFLVQKLIRVFHFD